MNEYEITYLADPKLDEKAKDELDAVIDNEIAKMEGEISYSSLTDAPGSRRRMIYPVKKQRVAWMRCVQVKLDQTRIEELRSLIRKNENVLRVAVLQTPRRDEVSAQIFETEEKAATPVSSQLKDQKESKEVTMAEVEEKIEEALDQQVK